jgi:hypothetical protein
MSPEFTSRAFGVRLEDDMPLTEKGAELLTPQSPSLEQPFGRKRFFARDLMAESILNQFAKALATGTIRVVDLSQSLDAKTATIQLPPEFAKSSPFRLEEISKYDSRGPFWYWNNFSCEHTGTHLTRRFIGSAVRTILATPPIPSARRNF